MRCPCLLLGSLWLAFAPPLLAAPPVQPTPPASQPSAAAASPKPASQPLAAAASPKPASQPSAAAAPPKPVSQLSAAAAPPKPVSQPSAAAAPPKPVSQPSAAAAPPRSRPSSPRPSFAFLQAKEWKAASLFGGIKEPFFQTEGALYITAPILWEFELVKKRLTLLLDILPKLPKPPVSSVRWKALFFLAKIYQQFGQMYGMIGVMARDAKPPLDAALQKALFTEIREKQRLFWWQSLASLVALLQEFPSHPERSEALFLQSEILLFLSFQDDSRLLLEEILRVSPRSPNIARAAASLAQIYLSEKKARAALGAYEVALQAPGEQRPFLLYRRALILMSLGELPAAEKDLLAVIQGLEEARKKADLIGLNRLNTLRDKVGQALVVPLLSRRHPREIVQSLEALPDPVLAKDVLKHLGERLVLQESWKTHHAIFSAALEREIDPWVRLRWRLEILQGILVLQKKKERSFPPSEVLALLEKSGIEFEALRLQAPADPQLRRLALSFRSSLLGFAQDKESALRVSSQGLLRWLEHVYLRPALQPKR